jgi:two-component system cell cycle response regulator DivK
MRRFRRKSFASPPDGLVAELASPSGGPLSCAQMPEAAPFVLVVEDDPETRRFYSDALTRDGFAVDQAHNGLQALEKALKAPPDLVVTDIAVPGIDGIELCRRLRADERTRAVPVLAITGYEDRQYPDRALVAGADHVLIKPCDPERIVTEARRLLGRALLPASSNSSRENASPEN